MAWKKSLEQTLHEQDTELRELRKRVGKTGASTNRSMLLSKELVESGLPDASQARLRKQLPATAGKDEINAAIATEREFVRKVRAGTNQGDQSARLVESYKLLGLSEKEAGIAANLEIAVKGITESRQTLANAAKALGMSDAEAKIFSQI
jgi:hypothetical protein